MAKFCPNCGEKVEENQDVCLKCGKTLPGSNKKVVNDPEAKSKIAAGLFAIFLGSLGVHNFYLGYTGKAVAQLLLTIVGWIVIVGPVISGIWALVEGIQILAGSINVDASGRPLGE